MRLSVFNPDVSGDGPRNVVYVFTEGGVKFTDIGDQTVQLQVPGKQLVKRLTRKLTVEWHGGTAKDLDPEYKAQLDAVRDPEPHMGVARALVSSDLHAIDSSTLSLAFEEQEKVLLRISESFGLRGTEIDALHGTAIATELEQVTAEALAGLSALTLTLIEGRLPVEVLARQNLSFESFTQPVGHQRARLDPLKATDITLSLPMKEGW